ncbi:hypothetical protein Droror1_Dr00003112 [Drosera rotundifolia]
MEKNEALGFVVLFVLASFGSATFISDAVFESRGLTGRSLLQARRGCPVDFENQNYIILTSQCKGPQYSAKLCCTAFTEFACPFAAELNDMQNDCATTMFSYINLVGKYPPGLFANECKEGKEGLTCSQNSTANGAPSLKSSNASVAHTLSTLLLLSSCILIALFFLL